MAFRGFVTEDLQSVERQNVLRTASANDRQLKTGNYKLK